MTPSQWRLARRVIGALTREPGLTERQLAARLRVSAAELRPVVGMLLGRRRVQRCDDYLVIAAAPAPDPDPDEGFAA